MDLKIDLEQPGYLGLNEELRCKGFKVNIDVNSVVKSIEFYYSVCVKGLDDSLIETSNHIKIYTNENLRPVLDLEGNPIFEDVQVPILDVEGNPILDNEGNPTYNVVTQPLMIGVVSYWLQTLGNAYILPDLLQTLTAISPQYIR